MSEELVYLIRGGPYHKIGRTTNLKQRIKTLQTGHPYRVTVVHTWAVENAVEVEGCLHRQYASAKIHGDWFNLSQADIQTLLAITDWPSLKPPHPLLQWRERYEVQQKDLAKACEMSQATLSKIENWQRIPLGDKLERLMAYTGLSTDAFVRPYHLLRDRPGFLDDTHGPPLD